MSETDQSQMDIQKLSLGQLSVGSAPAAAASWFSRVVDKVFSRNSTSRSSTAFNPALITAQHLSSDATPTGRGGNSWESFNWAADAAPRRLCGDWSPKLKLLRYVTKMPALLFHFASDYSHQGGGYKAKVYIENGKMGGGA